MKNENGIEKSAILSGQTLVNLFRVNEEKEFGGAVCGYKDGKLQFIFGDDWGYSYTSGINRLQDCSPLVKGKKYYYRLELSRTPSTQVAINSHNTTTHTHIDVYASYITVGSNQTLFTGTFVANEHDRVGVYVVDEKNGETITGTFMVLEYVEGMENWDIPYFEGMQSVKMPVLTTTGKNLFNPKWLKNTETESVLRFEDDGSVTLNGSLNSLTLFYLDLPKGTYQASSFNDTLNAFHGFWTGTDGFFETRNYFTLNEDTRIKGYITKGNYDNYNIKLQLETGTQKTSYEPFKSNILTVNEEVELRGIGEVRDTLDLMTGEMIQNIGEIVLDGSEDWQLFQDNYSTLPNTTLFKTVLNTNAVDNANCLSISFKDKNTYRVNEESIFFSTNNQFRIRINDGRLSSKTVNALKEFLQNNPLKVYYCSKPTITKTVDLTIQDQDNQPQERMKLFPNGYINTSSSTFPPILELKGITHNNKLNMTTTNGTNNTQLATLDNLVLDGIICRDGTVVRDSYDVESGLYTKRVFRFTIDEEFVERYRDKWIVTKNDKIVQLAVQKQYTNLLDSVTGKGSNNNIPYVDANTQCCFLVANATLYIKIFLEEMLTYDVDGLKEWIKRNGAIEIAYQMATPQIIHMQPNMQPYVSTRPYQGSIESQGNILESSFLDYTSEQSIISPKPLGDGDVLRWEQGSQCYVYENDKEYIPLTDYNQPMGTVLDLEEEDGEQFVENLDGGDIIVDVPFKEKAVYERHLVSHEDNVIYPTQDKLDPSGKIEVDYICGETWQNPNDLADIRHVGTLREDGQYDVTIRRSGDDEIRLFDGTTHISLDGEGLNPSEFELTFFNSGGVEVGKYGDTSHTLEDCVLDSKLETGTVYGQTLINLVQMNGLVYEKTIDGTAINSVYKLAQEIKPSTKYIRIVYVSDLINNSGKQVDTYDNIGGNQYAMYNIKNGVNIQAFTTKEDIAVESLKDKYSFNIDSTLNKMVSMKCKVVLLEYQQGMENWDIPYFEGVGSTIVNGFTTTSKNLFDKTKIINNKYQNCEVSSGNFNISTNTNYMISDYIKVSPNTTYRKTNFYIYGAYYDQDKQAIKTTSITSNTFTTPSNAYYIVLNFRKEIDDYENAQLELNTLSTPYEPYKGITYNLPTPITLNKVGDVADTFDVVRGVETRNVARITFDGDENWTATFNSSSSVFKLPLSSIVTNSPLLVVEGLVDGITSITIDNTTVTVKTTAEYASVSVNRFKNKLKENPITIYAQLKTPQTIQHTLIPSTIQTMQEPTFILPQPLRSVPNGICDRLYWDENKGHYCIEKRIGVTLVDGSNSGSVYTTSQHKYSCTGTNMLNIGTSQLPYSLVYAYNWKPITDNQMNNKTTTQYDVPVITCFNNTLTFWHPLITETNVGDTNEAYKQYFRENPLEVYHALATPEIIDLPHLNKKLTLPTQPNTLPIGYKVEYAKGNPQLGLTIPYKQLNYPSRPQNIDFKMDIADYVLTWDDVKEARQYNIILNDRTIATVKEPQWNSGEEMYGYIMVEAQNELAENLSEELYIKTVPNAPAQLTVGHNPMTNYYDFEISFIKTSAIAEYYTVQYRIDGGEWVYKTIQSDEIDPNSKVLWRFSIYEINEQIEVWATATNEIGTNDILPVATYYMSPTPQWTYRVNSKELFVRWMDDSPYDTQYKLRYQYKSDGIFRYAYFEGDKQEIGKLYEALIPLADDEEVSIALCIISEKENLYTKPIKASKELDPNIKPPKNFNYHWLARGLIEFYWEDNYDVDVEYEAIVEHRLTSGNNEWITDTRIFSATDTEGTGTVYRLSYQMEDLEEIRVKVRMKWAMNETEWSESLTTVFIPVEGNPPQWIRRTQTQEGLLVEWEAQEYVDSYHVYVMSNGEELQHLETMDNFILVDLDYSNPIDIEIYEATRFSGGIQSDPSDKMCFRPTMDKQQMIYNVVTPDTLTYEIEVDTIQKGIKERQVIHDINTTPKVTSKQPMDVSISSPFTLSFHPLQLDVHQAGAKYYGDTELHIKTLDVKSRDAIEVLSFERITDQYGVDFTVYTPSASKYPITLEVNRVRIVCFGDSLTSGHPGFWAETGTGDPQHCYEYWLDRRLKGQYEIINKGYGSDTTDRMLARFDRDVLANNPQYCIIQGGTNDLYWAMAESMGDQEALDMKLDVMKANIMEMVKRCWDNNIVPIVGNLIPRTGATGIYKTALYDFNEWIISWCTGQAAEGRNIFYVDLFNAGKEAVPPTPIEDPTNPGAMNPIYDGDALFDEFGNIIKQGRGIHLNKEGYRIWAEAIPLSIFKTYDSGLRMYKDLHCTDEDNYDDSDKQNPFYTISIDNVRRSKTKTVVRYVKNIGKTQVLFAMYASDEYNMSIEFVGSDGEKGAYANGLLAPNMIAKVTMEINLDNKDSKASFNLHLAAREYNQN